MVSNMVMSYNSIADKINNSTIMERIFQAYQNGFLHEEFNVKDVNDATGGSLIKSPSFLSKHRKGNPGGYTEYFERTGQGRYILSASVIRIFDFLINDVPKLKQQKS